MSDSCSSSSFDPAPGSGLDDDLAITVSTQTLSLTGTDTSQRNDSEESEAIAETAADIPAQTDQPINSSSQQDAAKEKPSHSERACQSHGALSAAELTEEIYTIAETARNERSSVGADTRATVLVSGFEGPSEKTSINHTAPKEEPDHGVFPTSTSMAHEEGSDDNNGLTISETFLVHNETGQDADERAREDTPRDDYTESSSAVHETIADLPSPDIAQDRSRRKEGSWNPKEEAIHDEVWKPFDVRMKMLRSEREDLGARFATRLEERQREVQQNDTQENEDEDGIITEIEEEFRQERNALQNDIDDLNEAFTLEFSEREFLELRSQEEEPDEDDAQETSTGAYTLQIADASNANNDVKDGTGDAENGPEEVNVAPEDDLEGNDGDGTIAKEEKAKDEQLEKYVTEEPPIQPLNEQFMGDTAPASSNEVSSETDPANCIGRMTTTMGQENLEDRLVPQQAPTDATTLGTLSNDNIDTYRKSQESAEHAESESFRQNNRNDPGEDADSNHAAPAAHASIGSSGQQETSIDSKEAKSQEETAIKLKAADQPGEARTTSPSGGINASEETEGSESPAISAEVEEAGQAEVTGIAASLSGNNDSGLANNAPASNIPAGTAPANNVPTSTVPPSTVPTSTIPTNTNTRPTHNVAAEHASQRRVRHHARKAQPKKYGVNAELPI